MYASLSPSLFSLPPSVLPPPYSVQTNQGTSLKHTCLFTIVHPIVAQLTTGLVIQTSLVWFTAQQSPSMGPDTTIAIHLLCATTPKPPARMRYNTSRSKHNKFDRIDVRVHVCRYILCSSKRGVGGFLASRIQTQIHMYVHVMYRECTLCNIVMHQRQTLYCLKVRIIVAEDCKIFRAKNYSVLETFIVYTMVNHYACTEKWIFGAYTNNEGYNNNEISRFTVPYYIQVGIPQQVLTPPGWLSSYNTTEHATHMRIK